MRVIKPATIAAYWTKHRDARTPLEDWLKVVLAAEWACIDDARQALPHADPAKSASGADLVIFNVKGNAYRLITAIHWNTKIVYVRDFLTRAEYSKDRWKEQH